MREFRWLIHRCNHSLHRMFPILLFPFQLSTAGSSNPPVKSSAEGMSFNAAITPKSPLPNHLSRTFYDSVVPELPKVTHPLEYARIAYKVLYCEYEETRRSLNVLLESRAHAADQLEQLNVIIQMKKMALELRGNSSGESRSADKMEVAQDMEREVIDLTEEMDHSP